MLVPWAVFAIGAGLKFWRLTALFRRHLLGTPTKTERFRRSLERIWQKDQRRCGEST
jgi:cytochrome c biogenesis protein CcdA